MEAVWFPHPGIWVTKGSSFFLSLQSWNTQPMAPMAPWAMGFSRVFPNLLWGCLPGVRCATDIGPPPGGAACGQGAHHRVPQPPHIRLPTEAPLGRSQRLLHFHTMWILTLTPTVLQPIKAGQVHSRFREMEGNAQSYGDALHAFIHGWASHAHCKLHIPRVRSSYLLKY